ncbi:MAG: dipeptide ABC transporter ATP-binding protein [Chloroflexi bacterium]|jgi:peptide/nickel transport system ATP-binding protein|nr:dipeptide ABC transporter ATP-binding protein [Chloroflexota bacterium]
MSDGVNPNNSKSEQASSAPLLEVRNLKKYFPIYKGLMRRVVNHVRAVDDVSFFVREGETLGLVGESGCGKTTVSRCILRAHPPTSGQILFREADGTVTDLAPLDRKELARFRPQMQMIFQDPYGSLNPRMTIFDIISEPLYVNGVKSRAQRSEMVAELLKLVGLRPEYMQRYPHAFSGGQRQRIGIARALALKPRLIVADEPVSALDVSVQAQVLNLMLELQEKFNLTYLFVAHDLSVVKHICDRVAVMYVGKVVELASTEELFETPRHPYTAALMTAVPVPDPTRRDIIQDLPGEVASPANPPSGCYFHPRCKYAESICSTQTPDLREITPGHYVSCHRAEELQLAGISGHKVGISS